MIIIAVAYSNKTQWCLMTSSGQHLVFDTSGIDPELQNDATIRDATQEMFSQIGKYLWVGAVTDIFFYVRECSFCVNNKINAALSIFFPKTRLHIESNILGAARALWGDSSGITCILEIDSLSCLYENGKIIQQTPSLGYILGDEGSACHIGKTLLNAIFKQLLPQDLIDDFFYEYPLSISDILNNTYHQSNVNVYLSQFSPFCQKHIDNIHIKNLVSSCFDEFVNKNIIPYFSDDKSEFEIGFLGSVAFCHKTLIEELCKRRHLTLKNLLQMPMEGLIRYHKKDVYPTQ